MKRDELGYTPCTLCPHACAVDRVRGQRGICGETSEMRIVWMGLHRGEEPPLIGANGSGTVFFTGCPLHCAYCQNCQISKRHADGGVVVGIDEFADLLLGLQRMGAANANLVTGTHFIPSIVESLVLARKAGFTLPVVWNSSGFESVEALQLIDPFVDTYLIDVKTLDKTVAATFCGSASYAEAIGPVMRYLLEKHPVTTVDGEGSLHGLLVRHLVFPGTLAATEAVLRWFASHAKDHAWLSLMVQFVPPEGNVGLPAITEGEYDTLIGLLDALGIEDGFVQELADNIPWIPDFTRDNPFPEGFADPLDQFLDLKRAQLDRFNR